MKITFLGGGNMASALIGGMIERGFAAGDIQTIANHAVEPERLGHRVGEVVETVAALDQAMADLRFDAAANTIYHFVWDQFCDWYIELIKGNFDAETKAVAGWVLDQILVMLHPFMPFVTEELWSKLGDRADYPLITAKWPEPGASVDAEITPAGKLLRYTSTPLM